MRRREFLATAAGLAAWTARPAAARAQTTSATEGVTRTRLPNGFTLLVRENPTAPVVAMSLIARTGTRWETRREAGIVNLLQLMIVRGTQKMDGGQIVEGEDRMGGSMAKLGYSATQMYLAGPEEMDEAYHTFLWNPHHAPSQTFKLKQDPDTGLFAPIGEDDPMTRPVLVSSEYR